TQLFNKLTCKKCRYAEHTGLYPKKRPEFGKATDVIVNSVARDLQLDKGPLSKALLAKAGGELQVELTQEGQGKDIKEGCVLKTSGYDLSCRHVLHAVLPAWNQKRNQKGDITKQKTDAIVNITNQTFNLRNGMFFNTIADFCFHSASQPHNNLICTQGGNLPCKNIIHLVHSDDIKNQVSQTLMECEERQFTSVVFPAIGTGLYRLETMRVKVVELKPEMVEYKKVQDIFNLTCKGYTIQKIERIQNPYQMKAYQIKKQEMDAKNGSINNERLLFHGTDSTSVTHINSTGFNRSYAGLHAACYGNGTYFAVNACYSANDTYSKPDASGIKYMYLARVLVGEYCVGSKGLVVPHQKSGTDPTDLYDSVTDHLKKPNLFVIFNDIQAYPEYLITFYL
uniref:Poly [ADP-ribose] polymerase n=1 Tax=Naja naja TaxID=35670 RepID=A0A8C7E5M3_NAJNA